MKNHFWLLLPLMLLPFGQVLSAPQRFLHFSSTFSLIKNWKRVIIIFLSRNRDGLKLQWHKILHLRNILDFILLLEWPNLNLGRNYFWKATKTTENATTYLGKWSWAIEDLKRIRNTIRLLETSEYIIFK